MARFTAMACIPVAVAVGLIWVVQAGRGPEVVQASGRTVREQRQPPPTTETTEVHYDAPAGFVPVVDGLGSPVGFIPDSFERTEPSEFDLGSGRYDVSGYLVTDRNGTLTGYFLLGPGFVSVEQAADPVEVDRVYAEFDELQRLGAGMASEATFQSLD